MAVRFPARTLLLVVALVAGAVCMTLGTVSFDRKVQSFQPLGVRVQPDSGQWVVLEADAETGLRSGDRVLLVNGEHLLGLRGLEKALRSRAASDLIVLRQDRLETVTYLRPPLDLDLAYLILSLIGVVYLLIGLYTLFKVRQPHGRLFYLWCLASAVVYVFTVRPPFDATDKTLYLIEELARVLLPPLTLHFFLVFPDRQWGGRWLARVIPFLYLPAGLLLVLQTDLIFFNGAWLAGPPSAALLLALDRLELYLLVAFSLLAVLVLARHLVSIRNWEQHRQILWITLGTAAGYLPFLGLYLVPMTLGLGLPEVLTAVAVLPLALVPLSFAYAILRYKLWDMALIARDVITYTLTLLLGIFGFSLINLMIRRGIPADFVVVRYVLSFTAGLIIAGLLVPTKHGISSTLERVQYRRSFAKRRALSQLGRDLIHERDLHRLCSILLEQIQQALSVERTNLYLARSDALAPLHQEAGLPERLTFDALGEGFWRREVEILSGISLPETETPASQVLFLHDYRYAFPLTVRDNRVGLVVVGHRYGQIPLNSDDIGLIRQLLDQAALAIENAHLLDRLRRQLDEVVRLQQYNESIIESSPAGIAVLDSDARVVSANRSFAALAGVDPKEALGNELEELLPVDSMPQAGEGLLEVSFQDRQGAERYLQMSLGPLEGFSEDEFRVLIVNDVSDRVAMENALKEKDRLAALGVLAAGVAHEVNTPLTGISSYAQMLLAETPESDPRYPLLRKVERQTFRAARIVNNLLEYARNRPYEPRPVRIGSVIEECLELLRERMSEHGIRLEWSKPEENLLVMGNEGELQQVLINLMLNGIDAMADGGGTLSVSLESEDDWLCVWVQDTGPGICADQLDKIFQPFYSTKLTKGGTGLGLSISYDIVRRHNGDMRVVSSPGEGCRFIMELPRHHPES